MSLLLTAAQQSQRRHLSQGTLAPLAASLRADIEPWCTTELVLPDVKARLTRGGGRCPRHGVLLAFDPWQPHRHQCPTCGEVFAGDDHDRWWVMNRQLWLSERAVHGAALALLTGDMVARGVAIQVLEGAAARYLGYPNEDNVLGPTRPFFSTYLESIWTLQLAVALDLLEEGNLETPGLGARVRERVLAPSVELIASYDEGGSNRQVWNNAAILACGRLLGDHTLVERAVFGGSGVVAHLGGGLLSDGSWYEGENYHQFAHRGLWYGVAMSEATGITLPPSLVARFNEAFALPFLTALPDLTFPARRDSQYAVSLRQWRYAESCELGLARADDARLRTALESLYDPAVPVGDTGRATSTAEAERNGPPVRLDRSSLGWKALLFARAEVGVVQATPPRSVHLPHQGFAIFRRDRGRVYAALDYGLPGGGHGHPDRLNLWLVVGAARFLEDAGTGSYTDASLFWYRSTWAHNAPLVNGVSQPYGGGTLRGWGEEDGVGWVEATFEIVPGRTQVTRRLVVLEDILLDELSWESEDDVEVALPWHSPWRLVGAHGPGTAPAGLEDGAVPLAIASSAAVSGAASFHGTLHGVTVRGWVSSDAPFSWCVAQAPGPPGRPAREIVVWHARGRRGRWRTVLAWGEAAEVTFSDDDTRVEVPVGPVRVRVDASGCHVTREGTTRTQRRGPTPSRGAEAPTEGDPLPTPAHVLVPGHPFLLALGERHYRRSERPWAESGAPEATLRVGAGPATLDVEVTVRKADPVFAPARSSNPLDNEHPDINSDGVQLYVDVPGSSASASWILVPAAGSQVRITPRERRGVVPHLTASWRLTSDGYQVRCSFPRGGHGPGIDRPFRLNVVVNEISRLRERRRGQLVATGADGEWVYLRGDREDPRRMLSFEIRDA
jgi:hypothetical protein